VAHSHGHALSNLVFNAYRDCQQPAWIGKGFSFWASFEHLFRDTEWGVAVHVKTDSDLMSDAVEGHKPTEVGLRAAFKEVALAKGPVLTRLLSTPFREYTDVWSRDLGARQGPPTRPVGARRAKRECAPRKTGGQTCRGGAMPPEPKAPKAPARSWSISRVF
jgi:hypothetical protein